MSERRLTHGNDRDCPHVVDGLWKRCLGHYSTDEQVREDRMMNRLHAKDQRIAQLEAALKPFAFFASQWERQPLRGMDNVIYAIHTGSEYAAELRRSDCFTARQVLEDTPNA